MMEIKFRIYFEDEEPFMSEPIMLEDLLHGEDIEFRNEDDTLSLPLNDFRFFYKRNQNYKIMQYTGLHDKNGKEIYERRYNIKWIRKMYRGMGKRICRIYAKTY